MIGRKFPANSLRVIGALILAAGALQAQPRIASLDSLNIGYVNPGPVERSVRLVNIGDAPLEIREIEIFRSERVPVTAGLQRASTLMPGDTGVLHVQVNTDGLIGEYRSTVAIRSNDPAQPYLNLSLRVAAIRKMFAAPYGTAALSNSYVGEQAEGAVTLYNMSPEKVTVATRPEQTGCCECFMEIWADMNEPLEIEPGDSVRIVVRGVATRAGISRCELEFRALEEGVPPSRVRISAQAQEPVRRRE